MDFEAIALLCDRAEFENRGGFPRLEKSAALEALFFPEVAIVMIAAWSPR